MAKKEEYKLKNLAFLEEVAARAGVVRHPSGVLYEVIRRGEAAVSPGVRSIVTVHYKGWLINGRVFDDSFGRNCPEALRVSEVIDGWQIVLQQMHVGDCWRVYIPYHLGYGNRASGPIPAFSTLIFEISLLGIA